MRHCERQGAFSCHEAQVDLGVQLMLVLDGPLQGMKDATTTGAKASEALREAVTSLVSRGPA